MMKEREREKIEKVSYSLPTRQSEDARENKLRVIKKFSTSSWSLFSWACSSRCLKQPFNSKVDETRVTVSNEPHVSPPTMENGKCIFTTRKSSLRCSVMLYIWYDTTEYNQNPWEIFTKQQHANLCVCCVVNEDDCWKNNGNIYIAVSIAFLIRLSYQGAFSIMYR